MLYIGSGGQSTAGLDVRNAMTGEWVGQFFFPGVTKKLKTTTAHKRNEFFSLEAN